MLIQTTSPRILLKLDEHPLHICIHTLRKSGVSTGEVLFGAYATGGRLPPGTEVVEESDPNSNSRVLAVYRHAPVRRDSNARTLEPQETYPIEGEPGFEVCEYMLPFWELFREEDKNRNLKLVPFCTGGFSVTARSAFRADPQTYEERCATFQIFMPVTGGGILRVGDSMMDVGNPTFDPWAPNPKQSWKNLEIGEAYNRAHRIGDRAAIDKRRRERIQAAEASIAAEAQKSGRMLPPKGRP